MMTLNATSNVRNITKENVKAVSSDTHILMRPIQHMKPVTSRKLAT